MRRSKSGCTAEAQREWKGATFDLNHRADDHNNHLDDADDDADDHDHHDGTGDADVDREQLVPFFNFALFCLSVSCSAIFAVLEFKPLFEIEEETIILENMLLKNKLSEAI